MSADELPISPEVLSATAASMFAASGDALAVAVLATAQPAFRWVGSDFGIDTYRLILQIPVRLFTQLVEKKDGLEQQICDAAETIISPYSGVRLSYVNISPLPNTDTEWREKAAAWLQGQGVTNQGRVRSDNIASRECDGLLFRSEAEIRLYKAFKSLGVSFAPLPVFVRGGSDYRRMEPDFVVMQNGIVLVVEVDGDTVHQESPREAHQRIAMLMHEGAHLERVSADDCRNSDVAIETARRLITILAKHKAAR